MLLVLCKKDEDGSSRLSDGRVHGKEAGRLSIWTIVSTATTTAIIPQHRPHFSMSRQTRLGQILLTSIVPL
jgi:hypothetical protein